MIELALVCLISASPAESPAVVENLRCEYRVDPLGIDVRRPRLYWQLRDSRRDAGQTAYQVLVGSTPEQLAQGEGDLWDSGRVASRESAHVEYAGRPLGSRARCHWKVRVWDAQGKPTQFSKPALWTMGLLEASDWKARWIGLDGGDEPAVLPKGLKKASQNRRLAARHLRREFPAKPELQRATAWMSGLGLSELYLNGRKVGDRVLDPALTEYDKRVFYVTFDVTELLRPGANAVGVILGNGRYYAPRLGVPTSTKTYGYPKLLFQIRLEYADGSVQEIASDESWKLSTEGPIRANNEYDGEEYDARMELVRWSEPGYDDASWQKAQRVAGPEGSLAAQPSEPIRVVETLRPIGITQPQPGVYVFDMGQNMVGWCRLKVRGPRGTTITLRHAETLKPDGTLYRDNLRSAKATDVCVLKGEGEEVYEPRFTYHGFRFVELTGLKDKPELGMIEGLVVHDDVAPAGSFECSNRLVSRIEKNIRWGVRGNYRSISTDCPQRDERQGWLGDRCSVSRGETYQFDTVALYDKFLTDMQDSQRETGSVPDVCPPYWPIYSDNVVWPSTFVIAPGMLHEQYGDLRTIARHYDGNARWIELMAKSLKDGILPKERDRYGDWCVPPESPELIHSKDPSRQTSKELLATSYFYYDLTRMARYARLLGKADDERRWTGLAESTKKAFNARFFKPEAAQYDNGAQTSSVLPLAFGLVPAEHRRAVFEKLVQDILVKTKGHIGTGLVGGQWLMRVLSDNGRPDVAWTLATQETYPSWGYMVSKGATTVWELWNGDTADPAMNSGNHVMLVGDLCVWMYEYLAGIRSDPERPGFRHVILRPVPVPGLDWARATHRSLYGTISSDWRIERGRFILKVTVPPGSTATVYLPTKNAGAATEGGRRAAQSPGVKRVRAEAGAAVLEVGAGSYEFAAPFAGEKVAEAKPTSARPTVASYYFPN